MSDEPVTRLNPEAEALLGYTAAVDSFTQSLIRLGHLMSAKDLDPEFVAEVKATADTVMRRFRQEIEQSLTTVIERSKFANLVVGPEAKQ